jgi:hypothetical protein
MFTGSGDASLGMLVGASASAWRPTPILMDPRKPRHGEHSNVPVRRPRDVLAATVLLGLIVGTAFKVDLRPVRPAPVATKPAQDSESACYAALRAAGVAFQSVPRADAVGIAWPLKLTGTFDGVRVHGSGKDDAPTNYLDCRLARALLTWAPALRAQGVVGLEHYSMYRTDSVVSNSDKSSGHALGRAIDVAKFELKDGRTLSVLDDWKNRARGKDPCQSWPDDEAGRVMRQLVCKAAERGLFQIVVTPHYNDAHGNHVHLEVDPNAGSLWLR